MSDLTDMLSDPDFKTGDYTVTRTAAPTFSAGVAVAGSPSTFTTGDASLQPLAGDDLQLVPAGLSASDTRLLYTTATLRTVPVPDTLVIDSETWRVVGFKSWTGFGGTHQIAIVARGALP